MEVPIEYASVIINASNVTVPVIASEMTDASIGPTHGVHRRPRDNPTRIPGMKPDFVLLLGIRLERREKSFSTST